MLGMFTVEMYTLFCTRKFCQVVFRPRHILEKKKKKRK